MDRMKIPLWGIIAAIVIAAAGIYLILDKDC